MEDVLVALFFVAIGFLIGRATCPCTTTTEEIKEPPPSQPS